MQAVGAQEQAAAAGTRCFSTCGTSSPIVPIAWVSTCLSGWVCASSALSRPFSTIAATSVWSVVSCFTVLREIA